MSGRHRLRPTSAAIPALVVLSLLTAGPAAAAPVTLGGGSGIVVDGDTYCTLTTIGTDNRGELIRVHLRALRWSRREGGGRVGQGRRAGR
jgi:hypothetical protein